jgi:hypothetical protein
MGNRIAGPGEIFVCGACGKRSRDTYGDQKIDQGWDESCMLHAVRCREDLVIMEGGRVVSADAIGEDRANG